MAKTKDVQAAETGKYWRHPCFPDLGLFEARFTRHRYDLHTHPTYVIALITSGCERIRIGRQSVLAPAGAIAVVNPEEWHDGERGADEGWGLPDLLSFGAADDGDRPRVGPGWRSGFFTRDHRRLRSRRSVDGSTSGLDIP
ncbi:AraC family ligand binding domain-containing protein [Mesorhizobium sp. M0622]|uniref:AraC family ligand binding domain-containing protein n=1 Tax=Mesorhizobium sp. M0622 TaxID=2956975 RepID=UPI0033369602